MKLISDTCDTIGIDIVLIELTYLHKGMAFDVKAITKINHRPKSYTLYEHNADMDNDIGSFETLSAVKQTIRKIA